MRIALLWLTVTAAAVAAPHPGDPGTPEHAKAADLVKKLGHPRFPVREAAARDLLDMGGAAAAALREGLRSGDEEVRSRSAALLPKAIALDWQRKADAFLADAEGKRKHDLPLLAEYEKLVGKPDAGLRKLFAGMIRTNGPLFAEAAADAKAIPKAVAARSRLLMDTHRLTDKQVKMDPAEVAAVLFVQTLAPPARQTPTWGTAVPALLLSNPGVADAVADKDTGPAFRKLLVKWAEKLPSGDTVARRSFSLAARKYPIPEAVPELVKYAKDKQADVLSVRALAVEALGKAGGLEATAALETLLTDTTDVLNFGGGGGMESYLLGDTALAALITMSKKKLSDYGLQSEVGIGFDFGDGGEGLSLSLHGFTSADARKKAVQKWKAENPTGKVEAPKAKSETPKSKETTPKKP
jgi:HEAT repeat protein